MRQVLTSSLVLVCFGSLFLICYSPALFLDRQFSYRDAGHYYYPLNKRVQTEWEQGRWPLWEPEENAGMPLLGNPTAAVLYPGKLVFALLPYAWGARIYAVGHSALAFLTMFILMRSWGTTAVGAALSALAYAFGAPVLFQYSNIIYLIGAAWLPLGMHAVDQWVRLGRRWGIFELAVVLSMQVLGGDPQAAYLLGLAGLGYAVGLAWSRASSEKKPALAGAKRSGGRRWLAVLIAMVAPLSWCAATIALAQWLPKQQEPGQPTSGLRWAQWLPLGVNVAWGLMAIAMLAWWVRRGRRSVLARMFIGLATAAAVAAGLTAAQVVPVVEFIQQTGRARPGPHEFFRLSLEPFRIAEIAWPNILGVAAEGRNYWGDMIKIPGGRPLGWVPSLYLGAFTVALALSFLSVRRAPPWRVWLTAIMWTGLLGSLGQYTSPIWMARAIAFSSHSAIVKNWLDGIGSLDPGSSPVRFDGYLRDGDGGFYWLLATLLPGFRQFRFPAKLFTFTALGMSGLAGLGWDHASTRRARRLPAVCLALLAITLAVLVWAALEREFILASFRLQGQQLSLFGPFEAVDGYQAVIRSLGQAAIVLGLGLVLTLVAPRHPRLAGSAALVLMTADLAAANSRHVLTSPQSLFDTKPEVLKIIEDAERADPSPGPFRVHRMPPWYPFSWGKNKSDDRVAEMLAWERDTLDAKYGIAYSLEYTYTLGVAQLGDFDEFFAGYYFSLLDRHFAQELGVEVGAPVLYYPRRSYDLWNTRYMVVPFDPNGWRDPQRGFASFLFRSRQVYPDRDRDLDKNHAKRVTSRDLARDFRVIRNLQEYPRAWVVHAARAAVPDAEPSLGGRSDTMQEILYAGDPIWKKAGQFVYDPHSVAWLSQADFTAIGRSLSGRASRSTETVKVTYPSPQQAVLEVKLDSPGLVILADVYYPGWRLVIDGKPAPILRVNGLMRGAAVGSGAHRLVYAYAPLSFRIGLLISIAGLTALAALGLACIRWPVDADLAGRVPSRPGE